ncbi:MAG: YedE-related selenium metabolism membrane protein [Planctomycetota bacterium]|nr:MAG: YedE-related selenium metabolism membrane protein [Planctomycetota bacterium]
MNKVNRFFASRWGIIAVGAVIGIIAALLQKLGNPGNMGICVACFERDVVGALGLHQAKIVQYLRPEIPAFVLGAFLAALLFREFRARTGSAPIIRFVLGMFAMIGALVFLGCSWRAILRLAGGDWNAIVGLAGFAIGIGIAVLFLKMGFSLGRSYPAKPVTGIAMPALMLGLLIFAIWYPSPPLFKTLKPVTGKIPPGAMYAPVWISIIAALVIGFLAQRTRFCSVGAVRDVLLMRDTHLLCGVAAFFAAALILNLILGQFHPGLAGQPIAHNVHLLNFFGLVLAGLSWALAGGCPGRQLFMAGEGDGDAAIFVLGMMSGAAIAHNFKTVGTGPNAWSAVIVGLIVVVGIGLLARE